MSDSPLSAPSIQQLDAQRTAFLAAVSDGNVDRIRIVTRQMLRNGASTRTANLIRTTIEKHLLPHLKPYRVALLASFSIGFVNNHLIAQGCTEGLAVEVYQPGYDQYLQEILNPQSGLYRCAPDVIVLAIDGPRLAPGLYSGFLREGHKQSEAIVESAVSKAAELITELRRHTNVPILLHSLPYPNHTALGILDISDPCGQRQLIHRVNQGLATLSRQVGAVYLIDLNATIQSIGYRSWHDPRIEFFARSPVGSQGMSALARVYLRYLRALNGYSRKCVIVDLDNTLWGGVLGEEGPKGIVLGSEYPGNAFVAFQRALIALRERGVLLAIASKNNEHEVNQVFAENHAMVLSLEHFAATQINWEPKSLSVTRIAAFLNLDPRHIVFVDDDPAECREVEKAIPRITTISLPRNPEEYVEALLAEGLFDTLVLSDEDTRRAELYKQRAAAEGLRDERVSLEDYYRSLDMHIHLEPINCHNIARAAQMTQKTNQFNTTTRRYTEADISARLKLEGWTGLTVRVMDTFGDNGIVGLLLAQRKGDSYDIDTFLLSCRIINRSVETVMLHWLANRAMNERLTAIEGWIFFTERNIPVRNLYERHGFVSFESNEAGVRWRLNLGNSGIVLPEWFCITDESDGY